MKIKQNDTRPYARATLYEDQAESIVLDCSVAEVSGVTFTMKVQGGAVKIDTADADLTTDGTDGKVEYHWAAGDTDTTGLYDAEFEVTFVGGGTQTFPHDSNLLIEIVPELS